MKLRIVIGCDRMAIESHSRFDFGEMRNYYREKQSQFTTDSGLDMIQPEDVIVPGNSRGFMINMGICVEPCFDDGNPRGYYLFPRSSTGKKTPLRLANSVGIMDYTYRGEVMICVDNVSELDFTIVKGSRLFQICAPDLSPVTIELASKLSTTQRQAGGYGSTGV